MHKVEEAELVRKIEWVLWRALGDVDAGSAGGVVMDCQAIYLAYFFNGLPSGARVR